jgi:predicted proteasome-type protease
MIYKAKPHGSHTHVVYNENDPYLMQIREAWEENIRLAFDKLPAISLPPAKVRLVDR